MAKKGGQTREREREELKGKGGENYGKINQSQLDIWDVPLPCLHSNCISSNNFNAPLFFPLSSFASHSRYYYIGRI